MKRATGGYLAATRHPWPSLLFLLPLLAAYEAGVYWLGGTQADALRNGADSWLHWGLEAFGLSQLYWPPVLIALLFLVWSWRKREGRPRDLLGVCTGMAGESVLFAVGLLGLSRALGPMLDVAGIALDLPPRADKLMAQIITFVGAGIYEEVLFRLLLYAGVAWLLQQAEVPEVPSLLLAGSGSALIFSAAHHTGPCGEAFDAYVFLFRTLAGIYFTLLYQWRGFGIAVGAHACYDVLAGVILA
jgi:membrane protease YdiL (CAAX protease family)